MKAIEFSLGANKLLEVRYGTSEFKIKDDFWFDFRPDGSKEKTTSFCPNLVPDTDNNRAVIEELRLHYIEQKRINDELDKQMYQIRNKLNKVK